MFKINVIFLNLQKIVVFLLITILVDGLLPQLQIFLQHGAYTGLNIISKTLIVFFLAFLVIIFGRVNYKDNIFICCAIFLLYLVANFFFQLRNFNLSYILTGYNINFFSFLILFMSTFVQQNLSQEWLLKKLLPLSVFLLLLGILQYYFNDPIVSIKSKDGSFMVQSYLFFGSGNSQERAFSLFGNSVSFGLYLIFYLGIIHFLIIKNTRVDFSKIINVFLSLAILCAIYFTFTRNVYLGLLLSLPATHFYMRFRGKWLLLLPIISLVLAIFISQGSLDIVKGGGISNQDSLNIRQENWNSEIGRLSALGVENVIFGEGSYQSSKNNDIKVSVIDNTYISIVRQEGIIGLLLVVIIYSTILIRLINAQRTPLSSALFGIYVAMVGMSVFNILVFQIPLFALFFLFTKTAKGSVATMQGKRAI